MNCRMNFVNRVWIVLLSTILVSFGAKAQTGSITAVMKTSLCAGDTFKVVYTSTGFTLNCLVRVQLSDELGSWAGGGSTIGVVLDSSSNDTIECVVPFGAKTSSAYKLRLFFDSPTFTSAEYISTLQIYEPVTPNPSYNLPLCAGDTLKLTDSNTDPGLSFEWKGPLNFNTRNGTFPNASTSYSGTYVIDITHGACVNTGFLVVNVGALPAIPTIFSATTKCEGDSIKFTIIQTSGASYAWSGPAGFNPITPDPVISNLTIANGGVYIVTATGSNNCSISDSQSITVNTRPLKPESSAQTPVCSGKDLALTVNTPTPGATYAWSGPLGAIVQNPVFTNVDSSHSGSYIVTATLNNCTNRDTVSVTVNSTPASPAASFENGCSGDTLMLIATPSGGGIFNWFDSLSFSQVTANGIATRPNSTTTMSGRYFVALTSPAGCVSDTSFVDVTIALTPVLPSITQNNPYCAGKPVIFGATSTTSGVTYSWAGPNGFSLANNDVYIPVANTDMSGQYIIKATLGQCSSETSFDLEINPYNTPAVTITADPGTELMKMTPVTFRANAINAGTNPRYQWMKNGVDIPGATTEIYTTMAGVGIADKDAIAVKVTSNAACPLPDSIVSYVFNINVKAGITDARTVNDMRIYPNPVVNGTFWITGLLNTDKTVAGRIINITGDIIQTDIIMQPINKTLNHPLNINGIAPGIYILQLEANGQILNTRFTVVD